jgi:hypothetical protein
LWGTATALEFALIAEHEGRHAPIDAMLIGTTVGMGTGIFLATRYNVSRSRVGLINLSGLLGAGLGAAIGATAEVDTTPAWGGLLLGGQTLGLALGAVLTHQRPSRARAERDNGPSVSVAPLLARGPNGAYRGLTLSSQW